MAATTQPTMQNSPPDTIEKRSEVSDASTPASRSPRLGALATCMNSMPFRRPRRWSGVERLAAHVRGPAGDERADQRTGIGRCVQVADRRRIAAQLVQRERREERARHAEDHRARVDEKDAEQRLTSLEEAKAVEDRADARPV